MNRMPIANRWLRVLATAAAIALCLPLVAGAEPSGAEPDTGPTYETFIDDVMADHFDRFDLAGAVVTVVEDGEILMSKGYGHSDLAAKVPVASETTLFPTASVAKLFTYTAVMQLVEEGKLDLEANVNDYLTSFQIPDTYPEPVRVWHLLSHTAGFEDKPQVGAFSRSFEDLPDLETALIDHMPERVWEPGLYSAYSNYATALAAQLVAEVSGMSWNEYIEDTLFAPIGMTRSSASQPIPPALATDVTKVYVAGDDGLEEAMFEYSVLGPAGAIVTTGQDMGQFMLAHLAGGQSREGRLLDEATRAQMHRQLFTHDPRLPGNAHGFWESTENGHRVISHAGDLNTAHALLALVPEKDLGFYVSYNSHEDAIEARGELWEAFVEYALPPADSTTEEPVAAGTASNDPIDHLAGTYGSNRVSTSTMSKLHKLLSVMTVTIEGEALVTQVPGIDEQRWTRTDVSEFEEVDGPGRMIFGIDNHGEVTDVVFNGTLTTALNPTFAFFPLAWIDSIALHAGLLVTSLLLILSALALWPILGFIRRRRNGTTVKGARLARRWAAATGGMFLLFTVLVVLAVGNFTEAEYGVTPLLWAALAIGGIASLLTLGTIVHTARAWRGGYWGVASRIHYTVITLTFIAFVWQLNHWNLLGLHI